MVEILIVKKTARQLFIFHLESPSSEVFVQ